MNDSASFFLRGFAAASLLLCLTVDRVHATLVSRSIQEIKYKSSILSNRANDLHLEITGRVEEVSYKDGRGVAKVPGKIEYKDNNTIVSWDTAQLTDTVAPGVGREVSWKGNSGKIDKQSSKTYWTRNGNRLVDSLASLGTPPEFFFEPADNGAYAYVEFSNPEPIDIVYSGISVVTGGDLSHFDDPFVSESGIGVYNFPAQIYLPAGESVLVELGLVSSSTFQLAEARAHAVDDPLDLFRVATATPLLSPVDADFTGDGAIGLDDLALWRSEYGTTSDAATVFGDADGDEDADGRDFMAWQSQFRRGASATPSVTAVPEPTSASLVVLTIGAAVGSVRCRRRERVMSGRLVS